MREPTTQDRLRNRIARPSILNRKLMEFVDTNLMRDALAEIERLKRYQHEVTNLMHACGVAEQERDTLAAIASQKATP